jgi:hypothetical protein
MKKAMLAKENSSGRPAAGSNPMMEFRAEPVLRASCEVGRKAAGHAYT